MSYTPTRGVGVGFGVRGRSAAATEEAPAKEKAAESGDFDPSDHTVDEVIEYLEANPGEVEAVLAAEEEGKARSTLLDHSF